MKNQLQLRNELCAGTLDARLRAVYGATVDIPALRARLADVIDGFASRFGRDREVGLFSGPGRTELGGNHTDHQCGRVLAAAVNLDAIACAGANDTNQIRICSAGYPDIEISLGETAPCEGERGTSAALVRGIAARFSELGYTVGGFDAYVASTVLGGSGLSSSAAYEVLIGFIINHLFCDDAVDAVQIAQIGQYAENVFFGKPCGLMDQLASAVGGVIAIDFKDPEHPVVNKLDYDFDASGHVLCIIDTGADHADLTDDYASIPTEMSAVAAFFGKKVLREVDFHAFWNELPALRKKLGDRPVLRTIHYFNDNQHAKKQAVALESDDFRGFLSLVNRSGNSSAKYLQNLYSTAHPEQQDVPVALALAIHLLDGEGAVRVHGGGFAGTIQAFVPNNMIASFKTGIENMLGKDCCHVLRIRPEGGAVLSK